MSLNLPKGWEKLELGFFCTEHRRRAKNADLPIFSVSKDHGLIAQAELFDRRIASADTSNYKTLKRGEYAYDPMLLWTGSIGRLWRSSEAMISPAYTTLGIDDKVVVPKFFDTLIKMPRMVERYRSISHGTNVRRKKAHFDDFSALVVAIPPIGEQRAIAEVLGSIDEAITKTVALCVQLHETVEELAEALFTGFDARSGHKNVDGWRASTLAAEMASIQVGIVVKPASYYVETDGVPALRSLNVRPNRLLLGELVQISAEGHRVNGKSALRAGDVVTIRTGEPGKTAFVPDGIGEINCIDVIFSRPGPWLRGEYVSFFMNSRIAKRQIAVLQGGLAQQHLNVGEMKRIQINVPPLAHQDHAVRLLKGAWARIEAEEATLEKLKSLRAALSQELLSGRVRLPQSIIARHRDKAEQAA